MYLCKLSRGRREAQAYIRDKDARIGRRVALHERRFGGRTPKHRSSGWQIVDVKQFVPDQFVIDNQMEAIPLILAQ